MSSPDDPLYYAHRCTNSRDGSTYYTTMSPSIRFVKAHYFKEPIVTVRLRERLETDPPSPYWGWLATDRPEEYQYVWPSEMQVEMCFPYGTRAEADRGRGRKVNLMLEEVPEPA